MEMNHDQPLQDLVPISDDDMSLVTSIDDDNNVCRKRSSSSTSYTNKSLFELERDADRILDDIRNIGSDNSNKDLRKKNHPSSPRNSKSKNIYRTIRSNTSKFTTRPEGSEGVDQKSSNMIVRISTDTSVASFCSDNNNTENDDGTDIDHDDNDDDDDDNDEDSIVGELQRLESVTTTIRLSLIDTTNDASVFAFASQNGGPAKGTTTTTHATTITTRTLATTPVSEQYAQCRINEDYDGIIHRSVSIAILGIVIMWVLLYYCFYYRSAFSSSALWTINDQGALTLL